MVPRAQIGGRRFSCNTVPPFSRRLHQNLAPAARTLAAAVAPLWSYTAVAGTRAFVAAAVRTDPMEHSEAQHYDDRKLLRASGALKRTPGQPDPQPTGPLRHEYHCLAAKNSSWPLGGAAPIANSCNSACVGCLLATVHGVRLVARADSLHPHGPTTS